MFVRTGRFARVRAHGPWGSMREGLAGLHAACLPWLHERRIAAMGSDGVSDVIPSGYEKGSMPIHLVCIVAMGIHLIDNTDLEALSILCGKSNGLPVRLVLTGRHFDEATLLRVGHAFELQAAGETK